MIETALMTIVISTAILSIRHGRSAIASVWRDATRFEKCALVFSILPLPGPIDNLIGIWIVARIVRRQRRQANA